ncbi:MAG: flagellar assembly protein FliW [Armatimonadetes bacterium]|nr:flagellar assembly protein FliW [Armatimonadota bacterium]
MMTQQVTETSRFGSVRYTADDIVTFAEGLVGFPDLESFVLIQHSDDSQFRWLQSTDFGDIAFLVVDPTRYVEGYEPVVPDSLAESLSLNEDTPRLVYTIVSIPPGKPQEMTINLAGPIFINTESGCAQQVVIEDEQYAIKHRVFEDGQMDKSAA